MATQEQNDRLLTVSAPGKLFLAGEWAVLDPGHPALLVAINRRVYVQIAPPATPQLASHLTNNSPSTFVEHTINICREYLGQLEPFSLSIDSSALQFNHKGVSTKVGFGSSAAVTAACAGAILAFHGFKPINPSHRTITSRLAALAHFRAQGEAGSTVDVLASCYGGVLFCRSPDTNHFRRGTVYDIVSACDIWHDQILQYPCLPGNLGLLVGWTGQSSCSAELLSAFIKWKAVNLLQFRSWADSVACIVYKLNAALDSEQYINAAAAIRHNQQLIYELSTMSGLPIVTPRLKKLCELATAHGAAAKLSGAGGGDCGIALKNNVNLLEELKHQWRENDIWPIPIEISAEGLCIEPG